MSHYAILAQSEISANALGVWLELLGEKSFTEDSAQRIVWDNNLIDSQKSGVLEYEKLVQRIEAAINFSSIYSFNELIILVDSVNPRKLNPLLDGNRWDNMLAMLILTFPEIYWVFGFIPPESEKLFFDHHSLPSLILNPRRKHLFDATSLRTYVRNLAKDNSKAESLLPLRYKRAAAVDEELSFALFHAYSSYRFGYLSDSVCSWSLMRYLFNCNDNTLNNKNGDKFYSHSYDILLEDVYLNFPDKEYFVHLSDLEENAENQLGRSFHCALLNPQLDDSQFRILVSGGHSGKYNKTMKNNEAFLKKYKPDRYAIVRKPVGGIFDLWKKAQLFERLNPKKATGLAGKFRGQAPGFIWPPEGNVDGTHSAPGKLMLTAQHLLRRAESFKDTANTVEEFIRGAVLATDALELLRYQTPTLALQALCLKHEFEVKAEVTFLGVGHHFEIKMRLAEIEREVKVASRYFDKKSRRAAELDALVSIGNHLLLVFRNAGQFDEESLCMSCVRKWHRSLRLMQVKNPIDFTTQWIMAYAEWLLVSPRRFIFAIGVWFLIFWCAWYLIEPTISNENISGAAKSASAAWNCFIATSPGIAGNLPGNILNVVASIAGVFHLGVFISYLYSVVTRK